MVKDMFFGKKDKDVRLADKEYKSLVGGMSKKERKGRCGSDRRDLPGIEEVAQQVFDV